MTDINTMYPLAPVDDVLKKVGLPATRPLLKALSPHNVFTNKLGIAPPGDMLESLVEDIDASAPRDGLPNLPIKLPHELIG